MTFHPVHHRFLALLFACGPTLATDLSAEMRAWTSEDGTKSFEGELERYDPGTRKVAVTLGGGRRVNFSADQLSAADRAWLEAHRAKSAPPPNVEPAANETLLKETFDGDSRGAIAARLLANKHIHLAENAGPDGSHAIRVDYVGCERGSERVTATVPLKAAATAAKLGFDVRFEDDFQWVLGGKLHGLGPANAITGGKARQPDGWSARMMFGRKGDCLTYLYDQNPDQTWGIGEQSASRVFKAGRWHHVEFEVVLNDPGKSNGSARVVIDGKTVVTTRGVAFRGKDGERTEIRNLLFSTFHGGHDPEWAPKDRKGAFTTVRAYFDNFIVTRL